MTPPESSTELEFQDILKFQMVSGQRDSHLKELSGLLGVRISSRGNTVRIEGESDEAVLAALVLKELYALAQEGYPIYKADVDHAVRILKSDSRANLREIFLDTVYVSADKRVISPKSLIQKEYIEAIRNHDVVFGIGPAGTGKTFLAMAMAVASLGRKDVRRIILTRPAVEAGEKLGFLPGTLYDKVNPYLRPLYDALHTMMSIEKAAKLIEDGTIEVAPLAFMRGRTLDDSFVILDEAQNTTVEQMKMFLTRLGFDSKAVITGDVTQIDLPQGKSSGLIDAERILRNVRGIRMVRFGRDDVVRHPLVQKIIDAYDLDSRSRRTNPVPGDDSAC